MLTMHSVSRGKFFTSLRVAKDAKTTEVVATTGPKISNMGAYCKFLFSAFEL